MNIYSFLEAISRVRNWYDRSSESRFVSSIISVEKEEFARLLAEIKAKILELQTCMDSSKDNQLVKFNAQLFSFDPKELCQ